MPDNDVVAPVITYNREEDGALVVVTPLNASMREALEASGIDTSHISKAEDGLMAANNWQEGNVVFAGGFPLANKKFRAPTLEVPEDFYTRAEYAREYHRLSKQASSRYSSRNKQLS